MSNAEAAQALGVAVKSVPKWRRQFAAQAGAGSVHPRRYRAGCVPGPRTPMTVGGVPGAHDGALRQGLTGLLTPSPVSRRSDCMIWNVVV
jgi:hypothetical protein